MLEQAEQALTAAQHLRAQRALRNIGAPGTRVELRPTARDSFESSSWSRNALTFVAVTTLAALFSPRADARSSTAPQRDSPAMIALAQQAADLAPASAGGSWAPTLPAVVVRIEGKDMHAMHPFDRVRLCQVVAKAEKLDRVGRDWRDIYAVIDAESAWVSREGKSKSGEPSYGLAQLEMATARALNIQDPIDPQQALTATARLVKESVGWAKAHRIAMTDAAISVNYNLSTAARNAWNGKSVDDLPYETQRHVANFMQGRQVAEYIGRQSALFERALSRELASRQAGAKLLAQVSAAALRPIAHLAMRTPATETLLRSVEDEGRARIRMAYAPQASAGAPRGHSSVVPFQMGVAGLKDFTSQVSAALEKNFDRGAVFAFARDAAHEALAEVTVTADAVAVNSRAIRSRALFASSFPTLATFLGDKVAIVAEYAATVRASYSELVSRSIGGVDEIERVAARRSQAQAGLAALAGSAAPRVAETGLGMVLRMEKWIGRAVGAEPPPQRAYTTAMALETPEYAMVRERQ